MGALVPGSAAAGTLHATCATLDAILVSATAADTVVLSAEPGLCPGSHQLPPGATLQGEAGAGFRPSADESGRSLTASGGAVVLRNLIFKGNAGGAGGASINGSDLTFEDVSFSDLAFGLSGGGLLANSSGSIDLTRGIFSNNTAALSGGGARLSGVRVTVAQSTFVGNRAGQNGGGLAITTDAAADGPAPPPVGFDTEVSGTSFRNNVAGASSTAPADGTGAGGGLWVGKTGDSIDGPPGLLASRPDFAPIGEGGAPPDVLLRGNTYDSNSIANGAAGRSGGGAEVAGVGVISDAERYTRNTVGTAAAGESAGGGVSIVGTSLRRASFEATNVVVAGNEVVAAGGEGGGIYIGDEGCASECGSVLALIHTTVSGNNIGTGGDGAGVAADPLDSITVDRSIVKGNTAGGAPQLAEVEGTGALTARMSDICGLPTPPPEADGNICGDPKLAGPTRAGGANVHQTLGSPTIDRVGAQTGGLHDVLDDYEGNTRPTRASARTTTFDMGADELVPTDYAISVAAAPALATVGDTLTYTMKVRNAGPGSARLSVSLALPAGIAPTGGAGQCTGAGPVRCDAGVVASGATATLVVPATANTSGAKTARATVTGPALDLTPNDHVASVTTTVRAKPVPDGGPKPDSCASHRVLVITVRKLKGIKMVKARISVNGKKVKVKVKKGRFVARIDLRKIAKKIIRVRIKATTSTGKVLKGKRTYHLCRKKLKPDKPPTL